MLEHEELTRKIAATKSKCKFLLKMNGASNCFVDIAAVAVRRDRGCHTSALA